MSLLHFESVEQTGFVADPISERPAFWRRALAGVVDRLAPLPFLAFFFPEWTLVVIVYHLLCDCSPERRGPGKWLFRLRVVNADRNQCRIWQAILRKVLVAATQAAWCLWQFIPFLLVYELLALVCVLLDPRGRRPEDFLVRSRVVTEKQYRKSRPKELPGRNALPRNNENGGTG